MPNFSTITQLKKSKQKIEAALAAGLNIVGEIEIRGRMVKHNDLVAELTKIDAKIKFEEEKLTGRNKLAARTRAKLIR